MQGLLLKKSEVKRRKRKAEKEKTKVKEENSSEEEVSDDEEYSEERDPKTGIIIPSSVTSFIVFLMGCNV